MNLEASPTQPPSSQHPPIPIISSSICPTIYSTFYRSVFLSASRFYPSNQYVPSLLLQYFGLLQFYYSSDSDTFNRPLLIPLALPMSAKNFSKSIAPLTNCIWTLPLIPTFLINNGSYFNIRASKSLFLSSICHNSSISPHPCNEMILFFFYMPPVSCFQFAKGGEFL